MSSADDLGARLEGFVAGRLGRPVTVEDLVRVPGGASRETWSFVVRQGTAARRLILRRDPKGAPATSDRSAEYELLRVVARAGVPVPEALWLAEPDDGLGAAFLMEYVDGETIARKILRDDEYAAPRPVMAGQCGQILAKIHAVDPAAVPGIGTTGGNPAEEAMARYRQVLDSFGEPHPAFELAFRWLERRMPPPGRIALVHGDFRIGNLIVGPEGIRAVLDWELAHAGDPWEDLAWLCVRSWRFGGSGEVGGFGDREDLYAAYEKAGGGPVDAEAVGWWEVFGNLKWGIMCVAQSFTHLWGLVKSLELAAIGRRAVEAEHDLMELIS